ncbi:MAG: hypothetical protein AMXMBFR82_13820 [Candidatus Hydrogenedentota bacterium]
MEKALKKNRRYQKPDGSVHSNRNDRWGGFRAALDPAGLALVEPRLNFLAMDSLAIELRLNRRTPFSS